MLLPLRELQRIECRFVDDLGDHQAVFGLIIAQGLPRIDTHEYGKENGVAIAAYCTMYEVTKDAGVLASAEKAAARITATQGIPVKREKWAVRTAAFTSEDTRRAYDQMTEVAGDQGVYRRRFRA